MELANITLSCFAANMTHNTPLMLDVNTDHNTVLVQYVLLLSSSKVISLNTIN